MFIVEKIYQKLVEFSMVEKNYQKWLEFSMVEKIYQKLVEISLKLLVEIKKCLLCCNCL